MSRRVDILTEIVSQLQKIRKGALVPRINPATPLRFNSTVARVTRGLSAPGTDPDGFPMVFVNSEGEETQMLLGDVMAQKATVLVTVLTRTGDPTNRPAEELLDDPLADVQRVLTADPTWGGLAERSRIITRDLLTELAEPVAGGLFTVEIDYVEYDETSPVEPVVELKDTTTQDSTITTSQAILNALYNLFVKREQFAWIEEATNWPFPAEQAFSQRCPAIYFHPTTKTFTYGGSRETQKETTIEMSLFAVEYDRERFAAAKNEWVGKLEEALGQDYVLSQMVTNTDILAINADESVFPVIRIDATIQTLHVQDFKVG